MRNTVIVLDEELGSMSLAFERAGFEVVASYEDDSKACEIYKRNLHGNLMEENILETDIYDIPEADVIVGKLDYPVLETAGHKRGRGMGRNILSAYDQIISYKRPRCFLFETAKAVIKTDEFQAFTSNIIKEGYRIYVNVYDVNKFTGFPVNERRGYMIGIRSDNEKDYKLLEEYYLPSYSIRDICEDKHVDGWYYSINHALIDRQVSETGQDSFLCWRDQKYIETKTVSWNTVKVPLVRMNGVTRKLTHREVARLKGYPYEFYFDVKNKTWLYKKLMYASNIHMVYQIALSIEYLMNDNAIRNQQATRALEFEELVGRYLKKKFKKVSAADHQDDWGDFLVENERTKIHIEVKIYTDKVTDGGRILRICRRLAVEESDTDDNYVLIIGNVVENEVKQICKTDYGIFVWDITNILFLFGEFPDIRNEFVASLNYTIKGIEEQPPVPNIIDGNFNEKDETDLRRRLENVVYSHKGFGEYEKVCTEILKDIFGEFLTLWAKQRISNNGLYRFDLCCKIKHGETQEFFDTVKNFFHTKYIIFEFKNYAEPITQKEIYSTEKYLYRSALRCVAIIISRKGADENALTAARGCLRENGKLILCLSDEDLMKLIDIKQKGQKPTSEYLSDLLDDMLINLEK